MVKSRKNSPSLSRLNESASDKTETETTRLKGKNSNRNKTVKVTGFSLRPLTVPKLSGLFSRVGQVQKVYLSPDKNAAFVRFEFKSAISFVLEQEWSIGREILKVRPLVSAKNEPSPARPPPCKPRKNEFQQSESATCYTYDDYCSTRNNLWVDFPHEHFGAIPSKKRKRRRKNLDCLLSCVPPGAKHAKKLKKKPKRKKRCSYLESAASVPFGITTCVSEDTRQVFLKGHSTVPLLVPVTATAKDVLALVSDATKVPSRLLYVTVESQGLSDKVVRAIQNGSTLHYTVKGLGGADSGGAEEEERKEKATALKDDGNKFYSEKKYKEAVAFYTASIAVFPLVATYNNRGQCYLSLSQWEECILDCNQVLQQEPENMKALLRRGKARKSKGDFSLAETDLTMVHEKGPSTLSKDAFSSLQEMKSEQSEQHSEDQEQLVKDGSEQKLSKSARKRLKKRAMKNNQERLKTGTGEETAADDRHPETAAAGTSEISDAGDQGSAPSQTVEASAESLVQVTDKGDASRNTVSQFTHTVGHTVTPTSSKEDVKQWLQVTCGVTDENCLKLLEGLDGKVLFDDRNYFTTLVKTTSFPRGVAHKIKFLQDNPSFHSAILTWDVKKVIEFVGEFCQGQDLSKVEENRIDGPAFLSYKSAEEISQDFKVKKLIANHILQGRLNFLDGEKTKRENKEWKPRDLCQQERCDEKLEIKPAFPALLHSTCTEEPSNSIVALKEDDPFTPYKLHLQNVLHLQPLNTSESQSLTQCELRVVYHKRKGLNSLEKLFVFLILCKPEFCKGKSGKDACEKLWKLITDGDKVSSKWAPLLPEDTLKTVTVENDRVLFDGKILSFEKQPAKLSNIIEFDRTVRKLEQCSIPVMLIDKELLMEGSGYVVTLKLNKSTCSFPFGFHDNQQYWLFSSSDFGWGFERQRIDASLLGTLPRCSYSDSIHISTSDSNVEEQQCRHSAEEHNGKSGEQIISVHPPEEVSPSEMSTTQTDEGFLEDESFGGSSVLDQGKEGRGNDEFLQYVSPRPFKKQTWKYGQGVLRAVESGDNMLSRAVEFKFQASCPPEDDKALRSFLYKSLEFVCACLNARKNGTIYFGVAEKKVKEQIFRYGEICGIEMDQKLCATYYDVFYNEFVQKCFRSCFEHVKLCLTGPIFIPVRNANKYIIEIDIESAYEQTKLSLFNFYPEPIYEKYGHPAQWENVGPGQKKEKHVYLKNKDTWTGIFRRDGSETKYIDLNNIYNFERYVLPELCKKRNQEELAKAQACRVDMSSPEAEKLKHFIGECDASMFPILILPKLSEEDKENSIGFFEFLHYIRWSAIFDFDNDSDKNGIYSIAKSTNLAFEVHESVASDFKDMSVEDRKDALSFPKKTVWLFANGKTTGSNTFERFGRREWINSYWTFIKNAVAFYKNNSVIPPARRLVLLFISDEVDDGIMETSQDMKTDFGWSNVFFVFQSESVRDFFANERTFSDDIYQHSVVMPLQHVHHVICQCLKLKSQDEDKYVHTSSGADVPISFNEWQTWSDLDILNVRECRKEWDGSNKKQRDSKAQEEEINFYQGKHVSWWNLYFTDFHYDHVMTRSMFSKLISHIEDKIGNTEKDSYLIPIVTISHMPGAGGTTLAKTLLWKLKDKFKCAVLKNITLDTERQVTQFWESAEEGQDQQHLYPVVLLADNLASESSQLNEFELSRRLYRRQKEMQLRRPLAILIHCSRTVKLEGKFQLRQKLTEEEQIWMEKKNDTLEKQHPEGVGTFIAFLAMRHGFDQEFLQGAIVQYLDQNVLSENERKLIEYVSLISAYFPSSGRFAGLPVTSCDNLMKNFGDEVVKPWERNLSKVASEILIIEDCYDSEGRRYVVRIANQPYALALLQTALKKNSETLGDIVLRCLHSPLVSSGLRSSKDVTELLTQIIIERRFEEVSSNMTHMSPLIIEIQATDFGKAVSVLEVGYKTLKNEVFYQQLARLYMTCDLDKAQHFAQLAVGLLPEKRDFKHTLGVVHLRQFDSLTQRSGNARTSSQPLTVANLALSNFIEAQGRMDDDALSICFAYTQTIETVNKILNFLIESVPVDRASKLGLYLTEDDYPDTGLLGDLEETEQQAMKGLLKEGIKALRFMFYLAYSNSLVTSDADFQFSKDTRIMNKVTKECEKQMNIFAKSIGNLRLNTFFTSVYQNTLQEDNALRFFNVSLKGCFFESIFLQMKLLHSIKSEKRRDDVKQKLLRIQTTLESIDDKSSADMDNLMTIYLAREIAGLDSSFTSNKAKIYRFCNRIIQSGLDSSDTRSMRAHLYRVLVSWPQKYWEGFQKDEFTRSFQHKSPALWRRKREPLLPKVHFYITKESQDGALRDFHVCHWTEIYGDSEKELPPFDVMSQRLKVFTGDYKIRKKQNGEQFSIIDMTWKCAVGELRLTIWKIRGEKVFREERVEFYLGFSLRGPVAIIHRVLADQREVAE